MSDTKIALVGAPRSGNRLVQRMLQRHGFVAEVRHYGRRKAFRNGGEEADFAVWPVRDVRCWRLSCMRDLVILPKPLGVLGELTPFDLLRIHNERTLRFLAETRCPVLLVSYEELVADPEGVGWRIVEFVDDNPGIAPPDWKGWGEEVFDGNAKWQAQT